MNKLSVAIITKNAEENIRDCLEAVKWADEIIVVDNISKDKTVKICQEYPNIKVYRKKVSGLFGSYRNYSLSKTTGEWILILDADEIVTSQLADEIREAIKDKTKLGYFLSRKNIFLGQWIKSCGWWPDYNIRLIRQGTATWPERIHKTLEIDDKSRLGYLRNPLIHHNYLSLEQYFYKFNFYTTQLGLEEYKKGNRVSKFNFCAHFMFKPLFSFLRKYFLLKGYKDGFRGFFISFSSALVIFTAYAKLWEKQQENK